MSTYVKRLLAVELEGQSQSGSGPCALPMFKKQLGKHISYRELQMLAKVNNIPCNFKKETLRTVLEARLNGKEEFLNAFIKDVKEERRLRKKKMKEEMDQWEKLHLGNHSMIDEKLEDRNEKVESNNHNSKCIREILLQKMVNETSKKSVTICKTEMKAQYCSYVNTTNSTDYATFISNHPPPTTNSNCLPSNSVAPSRWLMPLDMSIDETLSKCLSPPTIYSSSQPLQSEAMCLSSLPIYSSQPMKSDAMVFTNFTTRQYGDIPQQTTWNNNVSHLPNCSGNEPVLDNSNLFLEEILGLQPQELETEVTQVGVSCTPMTSQHLLPPFETMIETRRKALKGGGSVIELDPPKMVYCDPGPLEYLAEMALMEGEPQGLERTTTSDGPGINNNYNNSASELIVGHSKPTPQDIPTWNNFLEQCSSKMMCKCKFGCQVVFGSRAEQVYHETHCFHQPFPCPIVKCPCVNQLGSLSTHLFNNHNWEVVVQSEGTYTIDFGTDHSCNFSYDSNSAEGPKRQTFLQLVNRRLFVIFVIGNYQSMQMIIYVQYVNDSLDLVSSGAIEILRPDAVPYQWKGRLFPVSYSSTRLIPQRRCLIFNMNTFPRQQKYVFHVKIRNHDLNLP